MKKKFLFLMMLFVSITMTANVITVAVGSDLQAAINGANSGDQVKVQAGTFTGNFTMKEGVQVSGGWNETFTTQTEYATILDGNASGRVLNQEAAFTTPTYWENLTIQNGGGTTAFADKGGYGVYLRGNGGLRDCLVQNNKFTGTLGESNGGGVRVDGANAKFVALEACLIKGNQGTHAGGVCLGKGTMINCIVEENTTTNNATGGVTVQDGSFLLNSIIRNNNPKGDFGGIRVRSTTPSTVANCLIMGNVAGTEDAKKTVGGIGINDGVHYLYNNTIVGNTQTSTSNVSRCGLRINVGAGAVIANNIVWGNIAGAEVQVDQIEINGNYKSGQAENFVNNAVVIPANFGTNTILLAAENPGFFAPESGDFTLVDGSALIDAGADAYAQGDIDLVGNLRIQGKAIDLGAYEAASKYVLVGQDLQDALDNAKKGDTLLVQAGTFVGNFIMRNGVNVSGGWNAEFTEQTQYGTILDGDAKDRVLTQMEDFDVLTVWDNLTFQNGKFTAVSKPSTKKGGGVYMLWNSQLKNCLIQNNGYEGNECEGGGVAQDKDDHAGDIVLLDCVIKNNTASHGGGVYLRSTAVGCVITENQTTGNHPAGGAHLQWGRLYNCQITKNHSTEDAGGIRAYGNCKIVGCLIADNTCDNKVAGVAIENALGEFVGNTVVNNKQTLSSTDQEYCGVRFDSNSDRGNACCNNIIYGNMAGETIWKQQCSYNIVNYKSGINGNNAIAGAPAAYDKSMYMDISAATADSLFTNYAEGDYTLSAKSPMINVGNMNFVQVYDKDLAGNDRVQKEIIDMGCFESPYDTPAPTPTAVKSIKSQAAKVKKMIANGQLLVIKENARYNILGVKLQ